MRIVSYAENPEAVKFTARVLNDPPPAGTVYVAPVPGLGLTSLWVPGEITEIFRSYLGELVNEWMRCGKKIMPTGSQVWANGMGLPQEVKGKTDWTLFLVPEGAGTRKRESLKPVDKNDPAFASWLWKVYWDYLRRFRPEVWFNPYGEVLFSYMTPAGAEFETPIALPPFLNAETGNNPAWLEAVLWFVLLLNSGYAHLLERCQICRRYFVRTRGKKSGQVYKRGGPTCGNCKWADSKERTRSTRKTAKDRMLEVAAKAWAGWKQSHRTPDRYAAVASRVNAECRREILITTRRDTIEPLWAKRNEGDIMRLAEQLTAKDGGKRNAKG